MEKEWKKEVRFVLKSFPKLPEKVGEALRKKLREAQTFFLEKKQR